MGPSGYKAVLVATTLATILDAAPPREDIGYELLFADSTAPVDWECWKFPTLPRWVNGSFILPGVGQFSFGGLQFKGALDGFGKTHRFQLSEGKICMRARMMPTGFYNESLARGTVAPGMLFDETAPPRPPCPPKPRCAPCAMCLVCLVLQKPPSCNIKALHIHQPSPRSRSSLLSLLLFERYPSCNVKAPNDNTFVNTIRLGNEFSTWTDSTSADSFNPYTLGINGKYNWTDANAKIGHFGDMGVLSSAHPLRRDAGLGDLVSLQIDTPVGPDWLPLQAGYVNVLTVTDEKPHERRLLHVSPRQPDAPYFHSFGVTADFTVLGFTPLKYEMWGAILGQPMSQCLKASVPLKTFFHVVPFNGSAATTFAVPEVPHRRARTRARTDARMHARMHGSTRAGIHLQPSCERVPERLWDRVRCRHVAGRRGLVDTGRCTGRLPKKQDREGRCWPHDHKAAGISICAAPVWTAERHGHKAAD